MVEILLNADHQVHKRQFALLDSSGRTAVYTGSDLRGWDGCTGSATFVCSMALGNGLAGRDVMRLSGS